MDLDPKVSICFRTAQYRTIVISHLEWNKHTIRLCLLFTSVHPSVSLSVSLFVFLRKLFSVFSNVPFPIHPAMYLSLFLRLLSAWTTLMVSFLARCVTFSVLSCSNRSSCVSRSSSARMNFPCSSSSLESCSLKHLFEYNWLKFSAADSHEFQRKPQGVTTCYSLQNSRGT